MTPVVLLHFHGRRTGVTRHVEDVARRLPAEVTGWGPPRDVRPLSWRGLLERAREEPLVVHAHRNLELLAALLLRRMRRRVRVVFTRHSAGRPSAWTRFLARRADARVVLTRVALRELGLRADVVPHGVDVQRFSPPADRAEAWRALGVGGNHGLGAVGRIRPATYLEKTPAVGWKGLISDPFLDGSYDINNGLKLARRVLSDIAEKGLPAATEFLDTIIPQYLSDLISWSAIGARTSESQIHRELASGLSMPIGFKNSTSGKIETAIDAVSVARHPHHFISINQNGFPSIVSTIGNSDCHIILRGSNTDSNYSPQHIQKATLALQHANLTPRLMIDSSHGNSRKEYQRQIIVTHSIAEQIKGVSEPSCGIMLESNLVAGKQNLETKPLIYGQSITDGCISWQDTVPLFDVLASAIQQRRTRKVSLKQASLYNDKN